MNEILDFLQKIICVPVSDWNEFTTLFLKAKKGIIKRGYSSMNEFVEKWLKAPIFSAFNPPFLNQISLLLKQFFDTPTLYEWGTRSLASGSILTTHLEDHMEALTKKWFHTDLSYTICRYKGKGIYVDTKPTPVVYVGTEGTSLHRLVHELGHLYYEKNKKGGPFDFVLSEIVALGAELLELSTDHDLVNTLCNYLINLVGMKYRYHYFDTGLESSENNQSKAFNTMYMEYTSMKAGAKHYLSPRFWFNTASYMFVHSFSVLPTCYYHMNTFSIDTLLEYVKETDYTTLADSSYSAVGKTTIIRFVEDIKNGNIFC